MKAKLFSLISIYLIFTFLLPTSFVFAAKAKSIALVEVFDSKPSNDLRKIRHKLENYLIKSKKTQVVSSDQIVSYFRNTKIKKRDLTKGDKLFREAEDLFLAFKLNKALEAVNISLSYLRKKPGVLESLSKALLLKTQIQWELGKNKEATQTIKECVALNLSRKDLDNYEYSPKLRRYYQRVRKNYLASEKTETITLKVKGNKKAPLFVNGIHRGNGPELKLKVPLDKSQVISTGTYTKNITVKNNNIKTFIISGNGYSYYANKNKIGFKNTSLSNLMQDSQDLGVNLMSDQVVLLKLNDLGDIHEILVTAIDVKKGKISQIKSFEIVDLNEDANSVATNIGRYITTLRSSSFKHPTLSKFTAESNTKPQGLTTKHYIIGAAALVGGGLITALALSLGSGSSDSNSASVSLNGPIPK